MAFKNMLPIIVDLIPCELNCFDGTAYSFFQEDESDTYIVSYRFKYHDKFEGPTMYGLMNKGHYKDGGIALTIADTMLYTFGGNCYITGYCPLHIIDSKNKQEEK